jgi:hypothetical protein
MLRSTNFGKQGKMRPLDKWDEFVDHDEMVQDGAS